jgi:hypothetical protein
MDKSERVMRTSVPYLQASDQDFLDQDVSERVTMVWFDSLRAHTYKSWSEGM